MVPLQFKLKSPYQVQGKQTTTSVDNIACVSTMTINFSWLEPKLFHTLMKSKKKINKKEQKLTSPRLWPWVSMIIVFSRKACTGAKTAHGPPCRCTNADGSMSLNSKPETKPQGQIKTISPKTISYNLLRYTHLYNVNKRQSVWLYHFYLPPSRLQNAMQCKNAPHCKAFEHRSIHEIEVISIISRNCTYPVTIFGIHPAECWGPRQFHGYPLVLDRRLTQRYTEFQPSYLVAWLFLLFNCNDRL